MRTKHSIAKKAASVAAGTILAASLYANAVYQPRNESSLERALDNELQSVIAGEAELAVAGDGFVVVERARDTKPASVDRLANDIARIEAEMVANSEESVSKIAAAYQVEQVATVAQKGTGGRKTRGVPALGATAEEIAAAAAVISRISGVPVGQTIGTLAAIVSNPFVAAAVMEIANASTQPGGVAAAASNATGLSAAAQTLIATVGTTSNAGISAAVTAAASAPSGGTTVGGGTPITSP